jgi:hypothetical protein
VLTGGPAFDGPGYVVFGATLLPNETTGVRPSVNGSGKLCTFEFFAGNTGNTNLTLANQPVDTFLIENVDERDIPFTVLNGSVHVDTFLADVAVSNLFSKSLLGQNYNSNVTVSIENQGLNTETLNMTVYANLTLINQTNIVLGGQSASSYVFNWNSTEFSFGNCTLWAYVAPVTNETDLADNNCTSTIPVHVGVPGDVSSAAPGVYDQVCNMKDVAYLIILFNTRPSSGNWNSNADVDNNGVVSMIDIAISILNFNKHE